MSKSISNADKIAKVFKDYCNSKRYQIKPSEEENNLRLDISDLRERTIVKIYNTGTVLIQGKQTTLKTEMEKNKKAIQSLIDKKIPFKIARYTDNQMDSILKKAYSMNDIEKQNQLSEVLNNGIIISSFRATEDGDIRNTISKFKSREKITTDDAYELISTLTERPNSIFEIINSGWMYRYKHYYRKIDDSLFSDNMKFKEGYKNFKKEVIGYDELLLKSIENAQLHEIFQRGES